MQHGTVTERTYYDALMNVIRAAGGSGVQEVQYNSVPDIVFTLGNRTWLLSVKIGQDNRTLKDTRSYSTFATNTKAEWTKASSSCCPRACGARLRPKMRFDWQSAHPLQPP